MNRAYQIVMLAALVTLAACDSGNETVRYRDGSTAQIVESITSTDKNIDLVLTTQSVYMQLSEKMLEQVQGELDKERAKDEDSGIGETIKNAVLDNVANTLSKRIEYPLDEVNSIYWKEGSLVVDVDDEHLISFDDVSVDGEPAMESFKEKDARVLIDAFDRLKDDRA